MVEPLDATCGLVQDAGGSIGRPHILENVSQEHRQENADIGRETRIIEEWPRNGRGMVEPWWSTSEVVRDIGALMERPPTFSHEVQVAVVESFKIHIEVRVFESYSRVVKNWTADSFRSCG